MKKLISNFYLVLLFLTFLPVFGQIQTERVKVVGIVDGDTVTVLMKDKSQKRFQIKGIDSPELEQAFGQQSRQRLTELILDKNVSIEYSKIKPNGEIFGKIFLNGKEIGLEMLQTGFSWCDAEQEELLNERDTKIYCSSEIDSRSKVIGLWQDSSPQPPWEFRKTYVPEERVSGANIKNSTTFEGQVMEIVDGATIALKMSNNSRLVICISRLETPEPGQPTADLAEQHLKDLLLQKNVSVTISGFPEDENCTSADVYLNGININLQMVRDGVAWVNKNYYYPEGYYTYEAAEQAARSERRGIWNDTVPTPPWEYRARFYQLMENGGSSLGYGSGGYGGSYGAGGNKTVRVRAYTRSDGTQVRSYTRSAPGSGSSRSSSGRKH